MVYSMDAYAFYADDAISVEMLSSPGVDTYKSNLYTVEVLGAGEAWQTSYVYKHARSSAAHWHNGASPSVSFTTFCTNRDVAVRIGKIAGSITAIAVTPKRQGVLADIVGGQAIIALWRGAKVWVTVNADDANPLFIFADGPKPPVPAGATYFGPGITDIAPGASNHYHASDNEVIYLDGGAWVRGNIDVRGQTNVRVMGPGILSGDLWTSEVINALPTFDEKMDYALVRGDWGSINANVQDITMVASPTYNFRGGILNATGVKVLSPWYYSTDGFQGVSNCDQVFAFCGDNVFFPIWAGLASQNITVTNSFGATAANAVFCGGFWGNAASNNFTALAENVEMRSYNNDDWVPGSPLTPGFLVTFVNNDDSTRGYKNQTYRNCHMEGSIGTSFIRMVNIPYPWGTPSYDPPLGNSSNLLFEDVSLEGTQSLLSELKGYDASNKFDGVTFDNLTINGTLITSGNAATYLDTNAFVTNLTYT